MFSFIEYYLSKLIKKSRLKSVKNSKIHHTSKIESGSNIVSVVMGKHSFCGYNCEILNTSIGSFCSIANNVIIGGSMHPMDWVSMSPVFYKGRDSVKTKYAMHKLPEQKKTIIEHDVWIGNNAIIKQGVTICTGAIVGMGSIVTKDVAPFTIVAGNPATIIRKRFDDETIYLLLKSKWWDFSDSELKRLGKYFTDPMKFIEVIKK